MGQTVVSAVTGAASATQQFASTAVETLTQGEFTEQAQTTFQQNQLRREANAERFGNLVEFIGNLPGELREGGFSELVQTEQQQQGDPNASAVVRFLVLLAAIRIALGVVQAGIGIAETKVKIAWFLAITGLSFGFRLVVERGTPGGGPQPFGLGQGFMETDNRFPTRWRNLSVVAEPDVADPGTPGRSGGRKIAAPGEVRITKRAMELIQVIQLQQWCDWVPAVCNDVRLTG